MRELSGGVSNTVLLIETDGARMVLKQSLARLRVEQEWFSDRSRILREAEALIWLGPLMPEGSVPQVLFLDKENLLYAMTAAPPDAAVWKTHLLEGRIDNAVAGSAGSLLGILISKTRTNDFARIFADQSVFGQLRIDPYYRTAADRHPKFREKFERMIESCASRRFSLAHGDWSPKNLLASDGRVMAIDWETVHYGDPSFDAAFLTNHFLLKSFYRPDLASQYAGLSSAFWTALLQTAPADAEWLAPSAALHLGGLLLARVDGKSPAEYLTEERRNAVRRFALDILSRDRTSIDEIWRMRLS